MRRIGPIVFFLILACCLPASAAAAGPPAIQYFAPSPLRNHEATLRYSVDPEGLATEYWIEYGLASGDYFEYTYPWKGELPAGDEPVMRSAEVPAHFQAALQSGTTYYWRVIAKNSAGTTEGPEQEFTTTDLPPPGIVTGVATQQTLTSASLAGTVDPEGFPLTGCRFRYVDEHVFHYKGFEGYAATEMVAFGKAVPCEESPGEIGSGNEPVAVHADVSGLKPGPYRFRLEAENAGEDAAGGGALFGPSVVWSSGVALVEPTEATVQAQLSKHWPASGIHYRVEYETGGAWQQTSWAEAPHLESPKVSVALTCLLPESEYRFRFAVASQAGTSLGPEQSFQTPAGTPGCLAPVAPDAPVAAALPQGGPPSVVSKPRRKHRKKQHRYQLRRNAELRYSAAKASRR